MSTPSSRPTLYSGPLSMFGAKVEIAALEKRLDVELVMVPCESRAGYHPKHPEVVRINPKQQVPVLVHGDLKIFDSTLGRIDTTVTVKPGQFAVFGQSGFVPRGAMLTDPRPTLFYVVRAQPAT